MAASTLAGHRPAFDVSESDARAYYRTGLEISGALMRMLDATNGGGYRLLKTGLRALDRDLTIAPKTVTAILGRPSMGKSTFIKAIVKAELGRMRAERKAMVGGDDRHGECIVYVTLEEPEEKIGCQLAGGLPFTWRQLKRGEVANTPEARAGILRVGVELERLRVIQHPGAVGGRILAPLSVERVMRSIEQVEADFEQKPSLVVLDYLQLLNGERSSYTDKSKTEHVMAASEGAVLLSRSLNIPIVMAVQASRETDLRGGKGDLPMPGLRDAQWASAIEQHCDNMIGVVRPIAVEGVRDSVEREGSADVAIGGTSYRVTPHTGRTLFALGVIKGRDDDASGRRYACHVDPDILAIAAIDGRDE